MSPRQIIVLVLAGLAAVVVLVLLKGMAARPAPTPTAEQAQAIAGEQVLVAAHDIQQGASLAPSDLAVALFPTASVSPSFVRLSQRPSAQADYVGAVARRPFVQGEPISTADVLQPDGHGFMAAELQPGFRAVAVQIQAQTAAGGFIQPNDHVDVIVTSRDNSSGGADAVSSDIVLQDVRVLALGEKTQAQTSGDHPEQIEAAVAVLELSPEDARALALADEMGTISLALRGVQAETVALQTGSHSSIGHQSGSVRMHQFGAVVGGGR